MEEKLKSSETSIESLSGEKFLLERRIKRMKNERVITHVLYVLAIIIILLLKCCSDKKHHKEISMLQHEKDSLINVNNNLKNKYDSLADVLNLQVNAYNLLAKKCDSLKNENAKLRNEINSLKNRKAIVEVTEESTGKWVEAKMVPLKVEAPYKLFLRDKECPKLPEDSCKQKICLDDLAGDSLNVSLTKQYRTDTAKVLVNKKWSIRDITSGTFTSYNYKNTYIEYLPNPYRLKAQKSFWWGVGTGLGAIALYGTTEAMGHPKFFDDRDNSAAWRKHNLILGMRIGSGILGTISAVEFGRTIYFHHMEGKFIINPTSVGLTISLDKDKSKK
jgi:hypothetical protein